MGDSWRVSRVLPFLIHVEGRDSAPSERSGFLVPDLKLWIGTYTIPETPELVSSVVCRKTENQGLLQFNKLQIEALLETGRYPRSTSRDS